MFYSQYLNILPLVGSIVALLVTHNNGVFRQPRFKFLLDLCLKLTTSFMAAGGFILFGKCLTMKPFFRTSRDDLVDSICSKNATNSSLPSSILEEIDNENIGGIHEHFGHCCIFVFLYACCLFVEDVFRRIHSGTIKELISLATSVILPNDNSEERKRAIVQRMMYQVGELESQLLGRGLSRHTELYLIFIGFVCCFNIQINYSYPLGLYFAVHLNESEWTVNCNRQATWQDLHILRKCQLPSWDCEFKSISIIPIDHAYFHLRYFLLFCFAALLLVCVPSVLYKYYKIRKLGSRRLNNLLLVNLLKLNVDYNKHREMIDAFERKLDERGTRTDVTRPLPQVVFDRATEAVRLNIYTPD